MENKPILICMTPVKNEAWVLHAFLYATSLWADYIIIADQQSTDGSREIALSYPKVILIDNNNPEFNEADRQKMLINKAREIRGDKILVGLDADEIFSANYAQTQDWHRILNSVAGDVFWFRWANICQNQKEYWSPETFYPWMFHDDGIEPHGNYVRNMHSMRIPYPISEKQIFYVNDFKVMHLAYLNIARIEAKNRFYKFVDYDLNNRSVISLSRSYTQTNNKDLILELPLEYIYSHPNYNFNMFDCVDVSSKKFWFNDYVAERIKTNSYNKIKSLDIWQSDFLNEFDLNDPRSLLEKILHLYLKYTRKYSKFIFIRIIDKLLKKMRL